MKEKLSAAVAAAAKAKKKGTKNLLDSRRNRMILSVLVAIAAWLVVTLLIQPGTTRTIHNVPVDFTYDSNKYVSMGLSIVNDPSYTVTLEVSGDGSVIGALRKEDFVVYPRYSSVKGPGAVTLGLDVRCTASDTDTIKVSIASNNDTVDVVFDTVETKVVPVRVITQDVTVASDYTLYRASTAPSEVTITGPSGELANVTQAIATVSSTGELSETTTIPSDLVFADESGNEVTLTYAKPDVTAADVTLTIYRHTELPLTFSLVNVPDNFDDSYLSYTMSQETLEVAGPAEVIDTLTELNIGSIDMSTFALNKVYELPIVLPNNLVSQENVTSVTINFNTENLATKVLNLPASSVQVINLPSSYTLQVRSDRIMNVTLCGPAEALEGLTAASVVAQIDAEDFPIVTGQQSIAVNIYVPADNRIFAIGSYTVQCQIESK